MENIPAPSKGHAAWTTEDQQLAREARVLSGHKLEQLVVKLQRRTGRAKEACWRFIIQYGLKGHVEYRRWTESEIELVRDQLVKQSIEEVAKRLQRSPKALRSMLRRQHLSVRDIRCDLFSIASLSSALRVGKAEIFFWIQQGWLQAQVGSSGRKKHYLITPEALMLLYKRHLPDLLQRGLPNHSLFEAYLQYCYSPKHTVGEQLLNVRRDKKERAAFAESQEADECDTEMNAADEERYSVNAFLDEDFCN